MLRRRQDCSRCRKVRRRYRNYREFKVQDFRQRDREREYMYVCERRWAKEECVKNRVQKWLRCGGKELWELRGEGIVAKATGLVENERERRWRGRNIEKRGCATIAGGQGWVETARTYLAGSGFKAETDEACYNW